MKIEELEKQYLQYLTIEKGRSKSTIENYKRYLKNLVSFTGNIDIENFNLEILRQFCLQVLAEKDINYRSRILITIRGLLKFARRIDLKTLAPEKIDVPKRVRKIMPYLEKQEIEKLINIIPVNTLRGLRDRAIIETLISTGLRVSELINLRKKDVDKKSITILGKGNKQRIVFLSDRALYWLNRYLEIRDDISEALFVEVKIKKLKRKYHNKWKWEKKQTMPFLKPLSSREIQRIIKINRTKAGIQKGITPHSLRHSFAVNLLENGANIFYVKELLGHSDISTTQQYLHTTNKRLEEAFDKFHKI